VGISQLAANLFIMDCQLHREQSWHNGHFTV